MSSYRIYKQIGNEETARMVKEVGGTAHTARVDVSKRQEVYRAAELVVELTEGVTILVNCAGMPRSIFIFLTAPLWHRPLIY